MYPNPVEKVPYRQHHLVNGRLGCRASNDLHVYNHALYQACMQVCLAFHAIADNTAKVVQKHSPGSFLPLQASTTE